MQVSTEVMEIMLIKYFFLFLAMVSSFFPPNFQISEKPGPVDFKCYVRHHGEGLSQNYGNYADAAILSA